MKTIEESVKDCIEEQLQAGVIEKVLSNELEKCITASVNDLFSWGGPIKKTLEEKIKSVMTPYLENYDYGEYIVKLDSVIKNILHELTLDNRKLLSNFENLVSPEQIKEINVTKIFKKWTDYCESKIETDKIPDYDYEGGYLHCRMETECEESSFTSRVDVKVDFICEEDEELNMSFVMYKYDFSNKYTIIQEKRELSSIRFLKDIEILLMRIGQDCDNVVLDEDCKEDEVFIEYRGDC